MRIGPKERDIILRMIPGEFVPPSVYLGANYGNCPSAATVRSLQRKKLTIMRYETWKPADFLRQLKLTRPGRETSEVNAAMMLTDKGLKVRRELGN